MAVLGQWKWLFVNNFEFYMEDLSTVSISLCFMCHMLCNCAVIRLCVKLKKYI